MTYFLNWLFLLKIAQGIEPRAHFRSNYTSPSRTPFAIWLKRAEGEPFLRESVERKGTITLTF